MKESDRKLITILTPSYNRYNTLQRLYESLAVQDERVFEWLVVDDGSTDQTREYIRSLISKSDFNIRYVYQRNLGKHVALNNGVENARGEYIFIVDSDDALTVDALKVVEKYILFDNTPDRVGLCFRRARFNGQPIGNEIKTDSKKILCPNTAARIVNGDLAYVFTKNSLKRHKFPIFPDEKFVPELLIWNKISDIGSIVYYLNKYIYLCDYLDDGYTKNFKKNLKRNPRGFFEYYFDQLKRKGPFVQKIKYGIRCLQCMGRLILLKVSSK